MPSMILNSKDIVRKKKNILAVDDIALALDVLKQALDVLGYETSTANDGKEALEMIEKEKPDLLITDIYMPGMNGIELLSKVRQFYKELPVILVTGFDADDAIAAAAKDNANAILLKPYHIKQLKELVEETLGGVQAQQSVS